jgi:outer membrane receptor protein involved in Fe transport
MIGLARGTSEFDVYYSKGGFESRIAAKHHTPFTVAPTWTGTTLKQLADETTLDASVSYEWNKRWSFRLQGHNLTNERGLFTVDNDPNHLSNDSGYDLFGRSYLFDVGLKL